jgi:hypothetical protein
MAAGQRRSAQRAYRVFDGPVERGVGMDQGAQLVERDLRLDREGEHPENLAAGGAGGGGADEDVAVGIGERPRYRLARRPNAQNDDVHLFAHHLLRPYAPDKRGGDVISPRMSPR